MHRAFSRLIEVFEGIAASRDVQLSSTWDVEGQSLKGVLSAEPVGDNSSSEEFIGSLVAKAQELSTESGLTVTSISSAESEGLSVVLQIVSDESLDVLATSGNLDRYCQELASYFEYHLKKRRTRAELPFPDLPANHEKNLGKPRLTKAFGSRVDPTLVEQVDRQIEKLGITKREAFEQAFSDWLDKLDR